MPVLQNSRQEAFAQARAKGVRLEDAYEAAGYAPGNGHASRVALREDVAERIAELRAEQAELSGANTQSLILALLRMAKSDAVLAAPGGAREVRLALVDAARLSGELVMERVRDRHELAMLLRKPY
jgi:hypothetical protein